MGKKNTHFLMISAFIFKVWKLTLNVMSCYKHMLQIVSYFHFKNTVIGTDLKVRNFEKIRIISIQWLSVFCITSPPRAIRAVQRRPTLSMSHARPAWRLLCHISCNAAWSYVNIGKVLDELNCVAEECPKHAQLG